RRRRDRPGGPDRGRAGEPAAAPDPGGGTAARAAARGAGGDGRGAGPGPGPGRWGGIMSRPLAALLLLLLLGVPAAAGPPPQDPGAPPDSALEAAVREVASHLRCVVCQGLSIQDSPSALAREMKQIVRDQLAAGRTADEVKDYFVARYGEWILLDPPARGFNLAVHVLPVLGLLGGAVIVAVLLRRWTRMPAGEEGSADVGETPP